ncbi:MYND-type domain-containing protein [Mycena indigotica]|uniref:MYND-type domain-containing protein n=1 Tax=Mycena indigotica TaxID=2126181 RepID=A0A8H6SDA3_9AGAR|nr:MYND-type domain-containing protein [Mycena indigotica]KAF7297319.1 MYND-type domain-containing protein [Mycena indigotica]
MATLHPDLRLEKLRSLPRDIQSTLNAVCRLDCSRVEVNRISRLIAHPPSRDVEGALPAVYFQILDPERIPSTSEELEHILEDINMTLPVVSKALSGFYNRRLGVPEGTEEDVWHRVFAWVKFLTTHHQQVVSRVLIEQPNQPTILMDAEIIAFDFIKFTHDVSLDRQPPFFAEQPGFLSLLFRSWPRLIALSYDDPIKMGYSSSFARFFTASKINKPQLEEILSGVGSIDVLGKLVVQYARSVTGAMIAFGSELYVDTMLDLVRRVNKLTKPQLATEVSSLYQSLTRNGFPSALSRVIHKLVTIPEFGHRGTLENPLGYKERTMKKGLGFLADLLTTPFLYPRDVAECIREDMLVDMLEYAQLDGPLCNSLQQELCKLLDDVLTPATAYYTVLASVEKVLEQAADRLALEKFHNPHFRLSWQRFIAAVEERSVLKRQFEQRDPTQAVCDNCWKIRDKSCLRRCGKCRSLKYCSVECQKEDWGRRGHKHNCMAYKGLREDLHSAFGRREIAFLRFVAHSRFIRQRSLLEPSSTPNIDSVTIIGLTGDQEPVVKPLTDEFVQSLVSDDPLIEDKITRARRSNGLTNLCVLHLDFKGSTPSEVNQLVVEVYEGLWQV